NLVEHQSSGKRHKFVVAHSGERRFARLRCEKVHCANLVVLAPSTPAGLRRKKRASEALDHQFESVVIIAITSDSLIVVGCSSASPGSGRSARDTVARMPITTN